MDESLKESKDEHIEHVWLLGRKTKRVVLVMRCAAFG